MVGVSYYFEADSHPPAAHRGLRRHKGAASRSAAARTETAAIAEPKLPILVLTRFLEPNRYPLGSKTL
jgi:hypothetical protein